MNVWTNTWLTKLTPQPLARLVCSARKHPLRQFAFGTNARMRTGTRGVIPVVVVVTTCRCGHVNYHSTHSGHLADMEPPA